MANAQMAMNLAQIHRLGISFGTLLLTSEILFNFPNSGFQFLFTKEQSTATE